MAVQQCPEHWTTFGILPYPEERYLAELRGPDFVEPDEAAVTAYNLARGKVPLVGHSSAAPSQ